MIHRLHKPLTCSLQLQLVLSTIIKMLLALQHGSTTAQCFSLACMRPVFNYVNQKKRSSTTSLPTSVDLLEFKYWRSWDDLSTSLSLQTFRGHPFSTQTAKGEGGQSNFYFTNSHIQKNYLQKGRVQKRSKMLSTQKMDAPLV